VRDDAAARLTTGTLSRIGEDATIGRSQALRQAMLSLMEDENDQSLAHPSAWAPFMVVGEGGHS
jgi:CHAT domain-containing protein